MPSRRQIMSLTLLLLWLSLSLGLYYAVHKPFTSSEGLRLLQAAGQLGCAVVLVALMGGLGRRLFPLSILSPLEQVALQAALGAGLLALATLVIGVTLGISPWLFRLSGVALLIVLRRDIWSWLGEWRALKPLWASATRAGQVLALSSGALMFIALMFALAPPLKWDALIYHLLLPRVYLSAGRIGDVPWILRSGLPQNGEMLYTWAMAWAGTEAATALGWVLSGVALVGLLGWLSRILDARAAWVGISALLIGQSVWQGMAWGYVDWLVLLYGVGTLIALHAWCQHRDPHWLSLAGVMVGLGLGVKYTAGVLGVGGMAVILIRARRHKQPILAAFVRFVLPAVIAVLPWLLKNLILTGNPVYPLLFSSGVVTSFRLRLLQHAQVFGHPVGDTLFLPVRATYLGLEGAEGYSADIGPLLLLLSGLAGLAWRQANPTQRLAFVVMAVLFVSGWAIWAVGGRISSLLQQTRFYFGILPAWAGLAAMGEWGSRTQVWLGVRVRRLVMTAIGVVLALGVYQAVIVTLDSRVVEAVTGRISNEAYLRTNLGSFGLAMQTLPTLPQGSRVLSLYEPRGFYCWPQCLPDESLDRWPLDWMAYSSPEAILRTWREMGFTHVLVYRAGVDFLRHDNNRPYPLSILDGLEQTLPLLILEQDWGAHALYRLPTQP
ncbi:glycosyltransferase family 39 protein [Thermanaerothrix sp. 4228-RoL]|uniref:Glycosyltransferase family 39 protein n=2 Tax=Thermanaerothrix TaxID=1077886 RepID=A0ABU3NQ02_9CHLR|nr:glycosyltransferase family 39 protein [Thermanaerothrix sp. 4228-RoL]MDT8898909.1 glycosyltransferase family 39 protein [Thermanaerothrix sp. 4228-RoL]